MAPWSWFNLVILEQRLKFGAFGKYNKYRRLCLEREVKTAGERLRIAKEVLDGPGVNTMEAQANAIFIRQHEDRKRAAVSSSAVKIRSGHEQPQRTRE